MIEEHHPMQIGMFPLDIKPCQGATISQQHQLLLQTNPSAHHPPTSHIQQSPQQLHSNSLMSMNGNERMLTPTAATSTTSASTSDSPTASTSNTGPVPIHQTNGNSSSLQLQQHHNALHQPCGNGGVGGHNNGNQETLNDNMTSNNNSSKNNTTSGTTNNLEASLQQHQQQALTCTTLVNGNCSNHNANDNGCSQTTPGARGIVTIAPGFSSTANTSRTNDNKSTTNPCGPGPPLSHISVHQQHQHQQALNILQSSTNRLTLTECNLNSMSSNGNSHSNGNNSSSNSQCNSNHHAIETAAALALQQHLLQHHHQLNNGSSSSCSTTSSALGGVIDALCPAMSGLPMLSSNGSVASCSTPNSNLLSPMACGYCCQPICDRYIMRVVDTSFHESCLKCATCSLHLVHSCFSREGKLYCRIDYERLFLRNRCLGCGHKIGADELVMRTLENVFHLKCFACVVCGAILKKGEQYVVKQGQLFCRFDYEKEVEMLQGYDFYGDDLFAPKMDGRRGPKRPRTILNTQQRRAFKASFEVSPKPCRKVRENLAKETGLSLRIVQVWFQNQRAKVKKIQKKAKLDGSQPKGTSDSPDSQESDNSNMTKIKDEAHSDTESMMDSPYATASSADTMAKLRTCIKDENDGTPFNCIETNKENCNKTNEPILNTILGLSYSTFQQLMGPFTQTSMINPIDRLYSMQNSYFRPDELGYSDGISTGLGVGAAGTGVIGGGGGGVGPNMGSSMNMNNLGHKDINDN
ncbi:uncharacterized protein LOC142233927 [Haematobia irritans]|uniref:uncharacterized protein LOC142233927 n=1 Tax=Haematobia irritans TaxID=7368 RepID=UPI003F4F516A